MKQVYLALIVFGMLFVAGCSNSSKASSSKTESKATEKLMAEMHAQVGMPNITNFQEKKWAKMIFELRDKSDLITYAYIVDMNGNLHYLFQCIGYGLPYSVQYSNPERVVDCEVELNHSLYEDHTQTLPQADPNGLYMPEGLSATWLMMYDPKTKEIKPVYIEPQIIVSPVRLH